MTNSESPPFPKKDAKHQKTYHQRSNERATPLSDDVTDAFDAGKFGGERRGNGSVSELHNICFGLSFHLLHHLLYGQFGWGCKKKKRNRVEANRNN